MVFFDEAQLVGEDQQPGLGLLHTSGLGFPTVVVLAGLSHTSGRLRSVGGLSRLADNAIINMTAMDEGECVESTARLLDTYGVSGDDADKASACATVARLSRGWPQHLHGAQRALCGELLRTDGVLADVDFDAVRVEADEVRRAYYGARLSDTVLDKVPAATVQVVARAHETHPRGMYDLEGLCEDVIVRLGLDGTAGSGQARRSSRTRPSSAASWRSARTVGTTSRSLPWRSGWHRIPLAKCQAL